jgi:hypothetical protein
VPRPLPAAELVMHRRAVLIYRGAQAVARGGARCASKVLGRCARPLPAAPRRYLSVMPRPLPAAAPAVRRGYLIVVPRPMPAPLVFLFQVLDRGAQVVDAAATLSQQEKNISADVQRKRVNFTRIQRRIIRVCLGRCPRRRSLFLLCTLSWCPGRCRGAATLSQQESQKNNLAANAQLFSDGSSRLYSAVTRGEARNQPDRKQIVLAQQRFLLNPPVVRDFCSKLRAPHRSTSLGPLAPHTSGPRDVPRCGALSLLQKSLHYRGARHSLLLR